MSVFTDTEIEYLRSQTLGRVATIGADGQPHVTPARALEIRGETELHETGGAEINPRFPSFAGEFFRIHPRRLVSWGLEEGGTDGGRFRVNSRSVSR